MKGLFRMLRDFTQRERLDLESSEEMAAHVEETVARLVARGVSAEEAQRAARLELGDVDAAREQLREGRAGFWLDLVSKDARLAARSLMKRPAFFAVCVLTIGLGVGAATALFALVDGVILRPLSFTEPGSLVRIHDIQTAKGIGPTGVASGNILDWRRRATAFDGIAGFYTMGRTVSVGQESEVVLSSQVTEDFFPLLRVTPALGRIFTPEETAAGIFNSAAAPVSANPVAMLSYGHWQRRFGGSASVLGETILIDRRPFKVIGVLPRDFALYDDAQIYLPWGFEGATPRDQHYVTGIARMKPGLSLEVAENDLRALAAALGREFPSSNEGWSVSLTPLHDDIVGDAGRTLWVLLGAVSLVLVVACANVALLSLARGLERLHESSIRLALGASRARLIAQFLMEALVISGAGGLLGGAVAQGSVALLRASAADIPRLQQVAVDPRALAFACLASALSTLISGLPAAWSRARVKNASHLLGAVTRLTGSARHGLRDALVVAEVALAVVLLAGASLLVRSYAQLRAVNPGFDASRVLVAPIFLDMEKYGRNGASRIYYETLVERLEALPGVESAGGATALPASPLGPDFERPVWPQEAPGDTSSWQQTAWVRMVTPRYFETLGIRVVSGRPFDSRENPDGARAVILSAGLAKKLWPNRDAVGQRLVIDYSTAGSYPYDVVGVVNDVRFGGPRAEVRQELYLAHAQRPYLIMNMAVRTTGDPRYLAPAVRQVLQDLDARKPAQGMHALEDLLGATYARDRRATEVLAGFAGVAILLALLGVHGMLSHHVRERRREIGVRMAIGADATRLLAWVCGHGLRLCGLGLLIGAALSAVFTRTLGGLLYGVSPTDPWAALSLLAIPAVGFLVSLHPAWRATRIDPAEVLRVG